MLGTRIEYICEVLSECFCHAHRHVNRKALDEYATFTEQKTELKRRQEENAKGEAKIKQLIATLDLRKDEAIERTFKATKRLL